MDDDDKHVSEDNFMLGKVIPVTRVYYCVCYQRGSLMDETFGLSAGRSRVQIPGRGKCFAKNHSS